MKRSLKIAYFFDNFYPQVNGVITSSINTAFEFARRGHEVFAFASYTNGDLNNLPEDYFPFPGYFQKGSAAFFYPDFSFTYPFSSKIANELKRIKPDLIHFHAPLTMGYQAIRNARRLNIPVISTFHTFFAEPEYLSVIGMRDSKFLYNFGWWYSNQFFNRCDAVVSPAKATARIILEKKLNAHVRIIPNGVDVARYSKFKFDEKRLSIDVKKNEEWMLFIGRLSREKCIDVLLKAAAIAMSKRKSARLLLVGDGPYKKELKKLAVKLGIEDRVVFSGMIPNRDLLESGIIKKMKMFATASTSENQPMTILESMMFGLPIVGVDAKGVPEMVEGNGIIVKPDDHEAMGRAMIRILGDKKTHSSMSLKSLKLVKKYDIRNTTNTMEQLYMEMVEGYEKRQD